MEKYSAECYSWYKFLHFRGASEGFRASLYRLICEKKITMTEVFFLSNIELESLFASAKQVLDFRKIFLEFQRVNKLNLCSEFENIWRDTFIIPWANKHYPQKIKKRLGVNAPPIFFARGHLPYVNNPNIAVLGSEDVSREEIKLTWRICTYLTRCGYNILSNHNWGISEHAHKSALRAEGTTTAIISKGFGDFKVRKGIRDFGWEINSLFLSPYLHTQNTTETTIIEHARLISAWSDALIIVKSDELKDARTKSAANIDAAHFAFEYDIPVFVPASYLTNNSQLLFTAAREFSKPKEILEYLTSFQKTELA